MPTLRIPGRRPPRPAPPDARPARFLDASVTDSIDVTAARDEADLVSLEGLAADDVLEVQLGGGATWWTTYADLRDEVRQAPARGYASGRVEGDAVVLGSQLHLGEPSRGLGGWAIKALQRWNVDLPGVAADLAVQRIERKLEPGPGLYRCPDPRRLDALGAGAVAGPEPLLVFVHGTASNTYCSFGGLTDEGVSEAWKTLQRVYGDRVLAYEHATLSQSPLANALDLAEQVPDGARLHLVTHSRGGLVGEILARGAVTGERAAAFSEADLEVFRALGGSAREDDVRRMQELNRIFQAKNIRVDRLVRVACPAAGTTLAARRLDRYFSTLVTLLKLIPVVRQSAAFEFMSALLLAVVKKRADPEALPGLEAMMPGAPLVRVLNGTDARLDSALAVIAGDVEGSGLWGRLKVLATNLYYRADHDYVVNTASMMGGAARAAGARYFFDRGGDVSHFHYFRNEGTRRALVDGLQGRTDGASGYQPIAARQREVTLQLVGLRDAQTRPAVFVLPGIMGSHLRVEGDRVWVHLWRLLRGQIERLRIDAAAVEPHALVGSAYADIATFLERRYHTIPFPFDWRRSIRVAGEALAKAVREQLDRSEAAGLPVHLLAHSMGGLVARAMIHDDRDTWEALKARGGRLVMLGTPNAGSYVIRDVILGNAKTLKKLALVDVHNSARELVEIVARFPGLLELLPADSVAGDHFGPDVWRALDDALGNVFQPDAALLAEAKAFRDVLDDDLLDPAHVCYVAGKDAFTPIEHELFDDGGRPGVRFLATSEGDGRVPWAGGIPEPLLRANKVWYMPASHGQMAAHLPSFVPIRDLLETGTTARLPQTPPATRGVPRTFEVPDFPPETFPDAFDLEATAVGFEPEPLVAAPEAPRIRVCVTHGDLAHARYPVAVGHHRGDGIVSAERVLDHYLGGRLSERHRVGVYPGAVGTAEVVLDEGRFPPGALVVGLGSFGSLTAGRLAQTFTHGALMLALRQAEAAEDVEQAARARGEEPAPQTPPRLSTLLVGSGYGGLTMREAIRAILEGVKAANERLSTAGIDGAQPIDALEFVELYDDRAIQALHVVRELLEEEAFEAYTLDTLHVRHTSGGRRSVLERRESDWWQRVRVKGVADDDGRRLPYLCFTSLTDRARAEVRNLPVQRTLVDAMVADASRSATWDRGQAQAMFELLIPNDFKPYAADQRNMLWIVDAASAVYPWELMHDPSLGAGTPVAVRGGMLRQLATTQYRVLPEPVADRCALVVGDPKSRFVPLPGAQEEAAHVAARLGADAYETMHLDRPGAAEVIQTLFARPYQILHLAGHGVFEHPTAEPERAAEEAGVPATVTGMVIGDGAFLTPAVVEQMRRVPDLVFVNCCHLGRVDAEAEALQRDRHRLAANLGTQLIQMGVRAVVVAGWAVDDAAAATFAEAFYAAMLRGDAFGAAVQAARRQTYEEHPGTNTWGAYQCYGDPYFTLRDRPGTDHSRPHRYADAAEAVTDIHNLTRQAETAATRDVEWLYGQLDRVVEAVPAEWMARADVLEALALAHGALDLLPEAVSYHERLMTAHPATYDLDTLERGALLQVRLGARLVLNPASGDADRARGRGLINQGVERLEYLCGLGETGTRLATLGSARKHRARTLPDPDAAADELDTAAGLYRRAYEQGTVDDHPLFNWLMLEALLRWVKPRRPKAEDVALLETFDEFAAEAIEQARKADAEAPSFWNLAPEASNHLYRLLLDGVADRAAAEERKVAIVRTYEQAWRRGGAFPIRRSLKDQFDFLIDMVWPDGAAAQSPKQQERQALAEHLKGVRAEVLAVLA